MAKFTYASKRTPYDYICTKCSAGSRKLWREYNTFLDHQTFYCAKCACEDQEKDISTMDKTGRIECDISGRTDQIGWLVPAVPTEDGETFWGYTSVPQDGCDWWYELPNGD